MRGCLEDFKEWQSLKKGGKKMTTQGVITAQSNANLLSSTSSQVSSKSNLKKSSFDLFIGKSLDSGHAVKDKDSSANNKVAVKDTDTKDQNVKDTNNDTANKANDANDTKTDRALSKKTSSNDADTKVDTVKQKAVDKTTDSSEASKASDTVSNDQTDDTELTNQITSMLNSIQDVVMKLLNLTPEQMNQLLTDQGMTSADLLNPQNITKLVLANNGLTDITAMLTNENLADTMKQILQQVNQIKTEAALPFTDEQLKTILEQADTKTTDGNIVAQTEATVNTVQKDNKTVNTKQAEALAGKEQNNSIRQVVVEGTKISDLSENSASTQTNTGKGSSQESTATDSFQLFVENLVKSTQNVQTDSSFVNTQVSTLKDIANQIIDRIKVIVKPDQTSMELQLNPENLGKVNLSVQSKNGVMTAQFVVQNEISKEAIESQLNTLRETLNQQGIKVEAIEVTVAGYNFDQKGQTDTKEQMEEQKDQSKKKLSIDDIISLEDGTVEETDNDNLTGIMGNSVDYTA